MFTIHLLPYYPAYYSVVSSVFASWSSHISITWNPSISHTCPTANVSLTNYQTERSYGKNLFSLNVLCCFQTSLSLAAFKLPLCLDGNDCTTAQTSLAAQGWPSVKQRLANKSMTLPLCPQRRIAYNWLQFNTEAMPLCDEPLRQHSSVLTMKLQAAFAEQSGNAASSKLVWKQHYLSIE